MNELPSSVVSTLLGKLYVSIIPPDRSREAFNRTKKFKNKSFLLKTEKQSDEVDNLVFDASFIGDIPEIKSFIEKAPQDNVDILVYRFNVCMADLETNPNIIYFPGKPDVLAFFRLFLIENENIRNPSSRKH